MKKFLYTVCLSVVMALGTSCEDYLDIQSKQQLTLDNYYTSYEECRAATAALYQAAWYEFSSRFYILLGDGRGNNLFSPYSSDESFARFTETSLTATLSNAWYSFYIVVTQADYILQNIDKALEYGVSEASVNACKGEARFMRGLAYWYLGSIWGNVPIIEDPAATALDFQVPTNPFEDILQYAIMDLEYAAEWLPKNDATGRVTRYSALGLLSRLYITAACYARGNNFSDRWPASAAEYYEKARLAAKEVVEEGTNYSLMSDYEELFRIQNNNNSESLFSIQVIAGSSTYGTGNRMQQWFCYSSELVDGLTIYGGYTYVSGELIELMHNRGETSRRKGTFFYNGAVYDYLGTHTEEGRWVVSDMTYCNPKKQIVGSKSDTDGLALADNSGLMIPMLRLAEVYLLYAEAILGTSSSTTDPEALNYFNLVRSRAGIDPIDEITMKDIREERHVEFGLEGQYWFDLLRWAYWDQQAALNYMNNEQHRSEYYYYMSGDAPTGFMWRDVLDGQPANEATPDRLTLPYPESELIYNLLLREDPVPFDFENALLL